LEANYAGYLTESQRQRQWTRMVKVLLSYGIFTCFSGAFCFSFVRDYLNGSTSNSVIFNILFSAPMTLGFLGFFAYKAKSFNTELQQNRIKSVVGVIHNTFRNNRSATPVVQIQGFEFVIPGNAVNGFAEGEEYRIFYTPYSKIILSAERTTTEAQAAVVPSLYFN
jgi:hypothetical protein